uniref:Uncharacterized protein n=1 Tax=Bursaphelenchus xylophilus TaxID=6326 RepID=A0A1I7SQS1_BURXY
MVLLETIPRSSSSDFTKVPFRRRPTDYSAKTSPRLSLPENNETFGPAWPRRKSVCNTQSNPIVIESTQNGKPFYTNIYSASTSTNPPDHLHQRPRIRNNSTHQNGTPKQHVDHLKNNNPMQHSFVNNNLFLNRPPLPVGRENGSLRRTIQMNETEFPIVHPTSYGFEQRRSITQLPHDPHSQNRVKTMASPQIQVKF